MTFEAAMVLTRTIGSHTSFEDEECRAYFDLLMTLPANALIVEVGLEYGRSSSIALQVAKDRGIRYLGIDIAIKDEWKYMSDIARKYDGTDQFRICEGRSGDVSPKLFRSCEYASPRISSILIDGDHSYAGVLADCEHFLPHVVPGGYTMFHDYSRESLPEVTQAVNDYLAPRPEWSQIGVYGTLGIWRRIL